MKKKPKKILVIHGPNLNLLGRRERAIYNSKNIRQLNKELQRLARQRAYETLFYQSNVEGRLITKIQNAADEVSGILINPAAYTHTSVAIRDALLATRLPAVEVHLTNIYKREPFRRHSLISDVVEGQVIGFGVSSYHRGLHALIDTLEGCLP